jgi:hypothetical protein
VPASRGFEFHAVRRLPAASRQGSVYRPERGRNSSPGRCSQPASRITPAACRPQRTRLSPCNS